MDSVTCFARFVRSDSFFSREPGNSRHFDLHVSTGAKNSYGCHGLGESGLVGGEYLVGNWDAYFSDGFLVDGFSRLDHRRRTSRTQPNPASFEDKCAHLWTYFCAHFDQRRSGSL